MNTCERNNTARVRIFTVSYGDGDGDGAFEYVISMECVLCVTNGN